MLGYEKKAHLAHIGVIFSNISIALILFSFVSFLSSVVAVLAPIFLVIFWGVAVLFSMGLLLLIDGFYMFPSNAFGFMEALSPVTEALFAAAPYMLGVGLALSLLSAVLLVFEPSTEKHYGRIAFTCTFVVLAAAVLVGIIVGGVTA